MITQPLFAQVADTGSQHQVNVWFLAIPTMTLVILLFLLLLTYSKLHEHIDAFLKESKWRRGFMIVAGNLLLPLFVAGAIDIFDASKVLQGDVYWSDVISATVAVTFGLFALFFQVSLYHHEDRWNDRLQKAEAASKVAERKHILTHKINNAFREVVELKASRIRMSINNGNQSISADDLISALDPESQIIALLEVVYNVFKSLLETSFGPDANLRLKYFVVDSGYLIPKYQTDGIYRSQTPELDPRHKEFLCVSRGTSDCAAVYAAKERCIHIVEDTKEAHVNEDKAYVQFPGQSHDKLSSLLAIPVVSKESNKPTEIVICLDSDRKKFFNEEDITEITVIAENLQDRLLFELSMQDILNRMANRSTQANG